jgi:hypothetical protein
MAMRNGQSSLAIVALCLGLVAFVGCGGSVRGPTKLSTKTAAPLQARANQSEGAEATSLDVLGLSAAELGAFAALSPAERSAAVSVHVVGNDAKDLPAVAGECSVQGDSIRFTPRYPLARGMRYRATVDRARLSGDPAKAKDTVTLEFQTAAAAETASTTLTQVYPSTQQLPENQLKFYLHFSAPMSRGEAYRHIHLLDAEGQEMEAVFLELGEELWDTDLRRFTLLCDPGRVKRGLVPREELGSVLQAGKDYTLVIDADWRDAQGKPLQQAVRKAFHVVAPDHSPIDTNTWTIEPPKPASRDRLIVNFPKALDHSLLMRMLRVTRSGGEPFGGTVEVSEAETRWRFTPKESWSAGDYQIVVDTALEDLAGNSIGRAFDTDTSAPQSTTATGDTVSIPFLVSPQENPKARSE